MTSAVTIAMEGTRGRETRGRPSPAALRGQDLLTLLTVPVLLWAARRAPVGADWLRPRFWPSSDRAQTP